MGYFASLYVLDMDVVGTSIRATTTIFGSEIGPVAYFSWGAGERPPGLVPLANGTVFCDTELKKLPGYPLVEKWSLEDRVFVEASFRPKHGDDPVLFQFILPKRFIPRRDLSPEQPSRPFIHVEEERVIATYPAQGDTTIRFWISRLADHESLSDFERDKMLHPDEAPRKKVEVEFNFGFFKVKFA